MSKHQKITARQIMAGAGAPAPVRFCELKGNSWVIMVGDLTLAEGPAWSCDIGRNLAAELGEGRFRSTHQFAEAFACFDVED